MVSQATHCDAPPFEANPAVQTEQVILPPAEVTTPEPDGQVWAFPVVGSQAVEPDAQGEQLPLLIKA